MQGPRSVKISMIMNFQGAFRRDMCWTSIMEDELLKNIILLKSDESKSCSKHDLSEGDVLSWQLDAVRRIRDASL